MGRLRSLSTCPAPGLSLCEVHHDSPAPPSNPPPAAPHPVTPLLRLHTQSPPPAAHLFGSGWSCLLAHPVPSLGTITMLGSFPLFSDFRLGRFAGGGIRRAVATFPRLCKPCLGITARERTRYDRAHTSQEERPKHTPLLRLRSKTKPSELGSRPSLCQPPRLETGLLGPAHSTSAGSSWRRHHARVQPGPGSSAHRDHPCTMTWSWLCHKNPRKALWAAANPPRTCSTKSDPGNTTSPHLPAQTDEGHKAWPSLAISQGKQAAEEGPLGLT